MKVNQRKVIGPVAVTVILIVIVVASGAAVFWLMQTDQAGYTPTSTSTSAATVDYFSLSCRALQNTINLSLNGTDPSDFTFAQVLMQIYQTKGCSP